MCSVLRYKIQTTCMIFAWEVVVNFYSSTNFLFEPHTCARDDNSEAFEGVNIVKTSLEQFNFVTSCIEIFLESLLVFSEIIFCKALDKFTFTDQLFHKLVLQSHQFMFLFLSL